MLAYALENGAASLDDLVALEPRFLPLTEAALAGLGNPPRLKLVFIPTTLSGAEYSRWAGCTNPRTSRKVQFTHPGMFAALVVLDPAICRGTPDWVWRSTGVRAVDHCVENICSTNAQPASDAACERGLKRLVRALLAYARNPDDLEAKLEAQLGCNDAMSGLTLLVACGASHGIGHNLGPLGVGHGQTSCVLLPSVMKYNARANLAQQAVVKRTLWSDEAGLADVLRRRGLEEESSDAGDALRAFFDELGMPRSLKDVGVGRDKWDTLAENSLHDFFLKANPVPMTKVEQVMEVLEMCSGDQ
jgi:alcohol dehydrogenase class IV